MKGNNLGQMIQDTQLKLSEVINNSHLAPEVLELIIRNIHAQIINIISSNSGTEDKNDGKHSDLPASDI